MKNIETWYVYYGDGFWRNDFPTSFKAIKEDLKQNPRYNRNSIKSYMDNIRICKIGITSNLRIRKRDLSYKEGTNIRKTICFKGTYAQALKIESDLRFAIEKEYPITATHCGNDHFSCRMLNIMKSIYNRFDDWVNESIEITGVERV